MTLPPPSSMHWQFESACLNRWSLFDVPDTRHLNRMDRQRIEESLGICAGCPVRAECLAFGKAGKYWGIWGGVLLKHGEVVPLVALFARSRRIEQACGVA